MIWFKWMYFDVMAFDVLFKVCDYYIRYKACLRQVSWLSDLILFSMEIDEKKEILANRSSCSNKTKKVDLKFD